MEAEWSTMWVEEEDQQWVGDTGDTGRQWGRGMNENKVWIRML